MPHVLVLFFRVHFRTPTERPAVAPSQPSTAAGFGTAAATETGNLSTLQQSESILGFAASARLLIFHGVCASLSIFLRSLLFIGEWGGPTHAEWGSSDDFDEEVSISGSARMMQTHEVPKIHTPFARRVTAFACIDSGATHHFIRKQLQNDLFWRDLSLDLAAGHTATGHQMRSEEVVISEGEDLLSQGRLVQFGNRVSLWLPGQNLKLVKATPEFLAALDLLLETSPEFVECTTENFCPMVDDNAALLLRDECRRGVACRAATGLTPDGASSPSMKFLGIENAAFNGVHSKSAHFRALFAERTSHFPRSVLADFWQQSHGNFVVFFESLSNSSEHGGDDAVDVAASQADLPELEPDSDDESECAPSQPSTAAGFGTAAATETGNETTEWPVIASSQPSTAAGFGTAAATETDQVESERIGNVLSQPSTAAGFGTAAATETVTVCGEHVDLDAVYESNEPDAFFTFRCHSECCNPSAFRSLFLSTEEERLRHRLNGHRPFAKNCDICNLANRRRHGTFRQKPDPAADDEEAAKLIENFDGWVLYVDMQGANAEGVFSSEYAWNFVCKKKCADPGDAGNENGNEKITTKRIGVPVKHKGAPEFIRSLEEVLTALGIMKNAKTSERFLVCAEDETCLKDASVLWYLARHGGLRAKSIPYRHNAVAERGVQEIEMLTRAGLLEANATLNFWDACQITQIYNTFGNDFHGRNKTKRRLFGILGHAKLQLQPKAPDIGQKMAPVTVPCMYLCPDLQTRYGVKIIFAHDRESVSDEHDYQFSKTTVHESDVTWTDEFVFQNVRDGIHLKRFFNPNFSPDPIPFKDPKTLPEAELTCPRCLHEIRPVQRGRGRPSNHTKDVGCRQAPPRIFLDVKDVDEVYCRDPDQPSENAADSESAPAQARSLGEFSAQFINACVDRDILQSGSLPEEQERTTESEPGRAFRIKVHAGFSKALEKRIFSELLFGDFECPLDTKVAIAKRSQPSARQIQQEAINQTQKSGHAYAILVNASDIQKEKSARVIQEWRDAIDDELINLFERGILALVPANEVPSDCQVLPSLAIFTEKTGKDGEVVRRKCRWVACGNFAEPEDNIGTYAGVTAHDSWMMFLILIATHGGEAAFLDVSQAFTQTDPEIGKMFSKKALRLPSQLRGKLFPKCLADLGVEEKDRAKFVALVLTSMYGLEEAPKAWRLTIAKFLIRLGFKESTYDEALFFKAEDDGSVTVVAVCVDDNGIFNFHRKHVERYCRLFAEEFNCTPPEYLSETATKGPIEFLANLIWLDSEKSLHISSHLYLQKSLKKLQDKGVIPAVLPEVKSLNKDLFVLPWLRGTFDEFAEVDDSLRLDAAGLKALRSGVNTLSYAAHATRFDLLCAVNILAQGQSEKTGTPRFLEALVHLCGYVQATVGRHLRYPAREPWSNFRSHVIRLHAEFDANLGSPGNSYAREGRLLYVDNAVFGGKCSKQKTISTGTTEAEITSCSRCSKDLMGSSNLLEEVADPCVERFMEGDNRASNMLARNSCSMRNMRHLTLAQSSVRQLTKDGLLQVYDKSTTELGADALTKILGEQKLQTLLPRIGFIDQLVVRRYQRL